MATETATLTPLKQQFIAIKARYPNEILLFRLGDFYELFGDDAQKCAPILEVALTHRQQEPMCGVPAHSHETYLLRLIRAGHRVAICDQLEDPAAAKKRVNIPIVMQMPPKNSMKVRNMPKASVELDICPPRITLPQP